ncbi:unnamed protein product [Allacma fusca]|uniref:C2H2-type domain-containing protein n=1 Tax=Allacma fusca TaxID=39272 RepID=A0A8J2LSX6_9HEXA|nr:unnamed protein product [Allacma fusca]
MPVITGVGDHDGTSNVNRARSSWSSSGSRNIIKGFSTFAGPKKVSRSGGSLTSSVTGVKQMLNRSNSSQSLGLVVDTTSFDKSVQEDVIVGLPSATVPKTELNPTGKVDPSSGGDHRCDICGQCFTMKTNLTAHKRRHMGDTACPFCGRTLSTVGNLKCHIMTVHNDAPVPHRRRYRPTGLFSKNNQIYHPIVNLTELEVEQIDLDNDTNSSL